MLKFGSGYDWMATSSNAAAAFAKWGWYGLPGGPLAAAINIVAPGRFDAGKCIEMNNSNVSSRLTQMNYLFPNSYEHTTWFMGFAMYVPSLGAYQKPFISVARNGTALITAALCEFGVIELWLGRQGKPLGTKLAESAGGVYYNNTWNYIELGGFLSSTTSGYATVRVNTVPVIELVSTITQPTSLKFNSIQIGYMNDNTTGEFAGQCKWDDSYLTDNLGSRNNSWLGNIRVQAQVPSADYAPILWTPYPAMIPNWQAASNVAVDDTTYVYSDVDGVLDLYDVTPLINAPEVFGVAVRGAYRQTDATQRSVFNTISSAGVLQDGHEFFTPGTYAFSSDMFEVDPATGDTWIYTAVNQMKIGPRMGGYTLLDIGDGSHLNIGNGDRFRVS